MPPLPDQIQQRPGHPLPPLSVGKMTLRLYSALNYSHGLSKGPSFGTGRGLLPAERKEVIASLLEKTMGRLKKARSVQSHAKVWVRSVTDDDVIEYGLAEIRAGVGLRRFPDDFLVGSIQEIIVPAADGLEGIPKVEPMMGQGTLVWPDGSHVELQNLEAAQVAAMLLALGWSATLSVPRERTDGSKAVQRTR